MKTHHAYDKGIEKYRGTLSIIEVSHDARNIRQPMAYQLDSQLEQGQRKRDRYRSTQGSDGDKRQITTTQLARMSYTEVSDGKH